MRFGVKTQVAAGLFSLALLGGATSGCAAKPTQAQKDMANRVEAAASRTEAAAKSAADAAARAQAAASKAEQMFQAHMRK